MDEPRAIEARDDPALALADPAPRPCPNCKSPNRVWRRYCERCGCRLDAAPPQPEAHFQPLSAFEAPLPKLTLEAREPRPRPAGRSAVWLLGLSASVLAAAAAGLVMAPKAWRSAAPPPVLAAAVASRAAIQPALREPVVAVPRPPPPPPPAAQSQAPVLGARLPDREVAAPRLDRRLRPKAHAWRAYAPARRAVAVRFDHVRAGHRRAEARLSERRRLRRGHGAERRMALRHRHTSVLERIREILVRRRHHARSADVDRRPASRLERRRAHGRRLSVADRESRRRWRPRRRS